MESITLRQIELALAVEEVGAICGAAQLLHVAQPSVSQQILALERDLGQQIFERTPNGSPPTAAGKRFLDMVRGTPSIVHRARDAAFPQMSIEGPTVSLSVENMGIMSRVMKVIENISIASPATKFLINEVQSSRDLANTIVSGASTLGLGEIMTDWSGQQVPLGFCEYVFVLPRGHRLSGEPVVELSALRDGPWIETPSTASLLLNIAKRAGFTIGHTSRVTCANEALALALCGVGIALVPADAVEASAEPHVCHSHPRILQNVSAFYREPLGTNDQLVLRMLETVGWATAPSGCWVF